MAINESMDLLIDAKLIKHILNCRIRSTAFPCNKFEALGLLSFQYRIKLKALKQLQKYARLD